MLDPDAEETVPAANRLTLGGPSLRAGPTGHHGRLAVDAHGQVVDIERLIGGLPGWRLPLAAIDLVLGHPLRPGLELARVARVSEVAGEHAIEEPAVPRDNGSAELTGAIAIESTVGLGTRVILTLPIKP